MHWLPACAFAFANVKAVAQLANAASWQRGDGAAIPMWGHLTKSPVHISCTMHSALKGCLLRCCANLVFFFSLLVSCGWAAIVVLVASLQSCAHISRAADPAAMANLSSTFPAPARSTWLGAQNGGVVPLLSWHAAPRESTEFDHLGMSASANSSTREGRRHVSYGWIPRSRRLSMPAVIEHPTLLDRPVDRPPHLARALMVRGGGGG